MYLTTFSGCCTARVFAGFDKTPTNGAAFGNDCPTSADEIYRYLARQDCRWRDVGVITAITTDDQLLANKAFRVMRWKHSKWISKQRHAETKERLWFISGEDMDSLLQKFRRMPADERHTLFDGVNWREVE